MNELNQFEMYNFGKQLDKLVKKYKNKKIVIYGAGKFCQTIMDNYDLSKLNIIAISDKKFKNVNLDSSEIYMNYKCVSPQNIHLLKPDIVLISVEKPFNIEKYFCTELFKQTGKKFKYGLIFDVPLSVKFEEEFAYW